MTFSAIADLTMMTETDDPSPIFASPDRIPPDDSLSTTDEIGTGDDLQHSREDRPREDLNTSTDAIHSGESQTGREKTG